MQSWLYLKYESNCSFDRHRAQRHTIDEGDPIVERNENDDDLLLQDNDQPAWKNDARPSYSRLNQTGFLIDPDTTLPFLGYRKPTKFNIKLVIKGKYASADLKRYKADDSHSTKIHIHKL
jgi:hypothetical protein